MTDYTVLKKQGEVWAIVGAKNASSARAAIRSTADRVNEGGTYIAVPTRSWKPEPVALETRTAIKIG